MADPIVFNFNSYYAVGVADGNAPTTDLLTMFNFIRTELRAMSESITKLQEVEKDSGAKMDAAVQTMDTAVKTLAEAHKTITDLADKLKTAGTDPAALKAITDDLSTHAATLSTATDALKAAATSVGNGTPPASVPADALPPEPVPQADPVSDAPTPAKTI